MIKRIINVPKSLRKGKVLIIYGPRQVGKTTLINEYLSKTSFKYKYSTGDDLQLASDLSKCTITSTTNYVGDYELIVIDEAQKIPNIGLALKLMVDTFPEKYFIATGSSSFDLASQTAESLTGRKNVIDLYPISQFELSKDCSRSELIHQVEPFLIYGSYPDILTNTTYLEKEKALKQLTNSYLLKDILEYSGIKNSNKVLNILKLLAFQIGSEVSTVEIASSVGIDSKTVANYLDLFEKSFVIFSLRGFSRNLRKEVTKMSKYYFCDTGIRNALILNFNKLEDRNDIGQLWENFLMIERRKRNSYKDFNTNYYFWRTYDQKEIDLIEENSGKLNGFEFKWQEKQSKPPKLWLETYYNASYSEVNKENYLDFIT
ncbi:MAG: ATP-binding protein [bacterium]|nr:ATP-binding protein [bacterium]